MLHNSSICIVEELNYIIIFMNIYYNIYEIINKNKRKEGKNIYIKYIYINRFLYVRLKEN